MDSDKENCSASWRVRQQYSRKPPSHSVQDPAHWYGIMYSPERVTFKQVGHDMKIISYSMLHWLQVCQDARPFSHRDPCLDHPDNPGHLDVGRLDTGRGALVCLVASDTGKKRSRGPARRILRCRPGLRTGPFLAGPWSSRHCCRCPREQTQAARALQG